MAPATISTIPEELRQEITSYLNYDDAWSLKQASLLFYRIVEIPTIRSFLDCPYGPSLCMLEEWEIIPTGHEACYYCKRLLPKERFSRFQRHLTAARQNSFCFDYATWDPEKHYCLECGVKHLHYPGGKRVFVGFGDPGCKNEAVMPCKHCGIMAEYQPTELKFCPKCHRFPWTYNTTSFDPCPGMTITDEEGQCKKDPEPRRKVYEGAETESLLALIGERLLVEDL